MSGDRFDIFSNTAPRPRVSLLERFRQRRSDHGTDNRGRDRNDDRDAHQPGGVPVHLTNGSLDGAGRDGQPLGDLDLGNHSVTDLAERQVLSVEKTGSHGEDEDHFDGREAAVEQAVAEGSLSRGFVHERILIAGDTHGNFDHVRYLFEQAVKQGCGRVVQVGDFGYWPHKNSFHEDVNRLAVSAGVDVFWLDVNQENFDALQRAVDVDADRPQRMDERLWYLPRGCTWTWDDCRFMALGGAYSIDKAHRAEGVSWWPQELLTNDQLARAMNRDRVDVLLTHDAPEGVCPIIKPGYKGDEISRGNRLAVTAVMCTTKPRLVVHGHYHHRYSTTVGYTSVEGLDRDGTGLNSFVIITPARWRSDRLPGRGFGATTSKPVPVL